MITSSKHNNQNTLHNMTRKQNNLDYTTKIDPKPSNSHSMASKPITLGRKINIKCKLESSMSG